jgi:hypothetical protein
MFWPPNWEPILKIGDAQYRINLAQAFHDLPRYFQPSGHGLAGLFSAKTRHHAGGQRLFFKSRLVVT